MTEDTQYIVENVLKISNNTDETLVEIETKSDGERYIELRWLDEDKDIIKSLTLPIALAKIVANALVKCTTEIENSSKSIEKLTVHLEPFHFHNEPPEECTDCQQETRFWLTPQIPLCQNCCDNRNSTI